MRVWQPHSYQIIIGFHWKKCDMLLQGFLRKSLCPSAVSVNRTKLQYLTMPMDKGGFISEHNNKSLHSKLPLGVDVVSQIFII